jgi:large subunit ribosomal protein L30
MIDNAAFLKIMRWHGRIKKQTWSKSPNSELPSLGEPTNQPIKIQQVRSAIGRPKNQGATLKIMGLRRIGDIIERTDDEHTHGMLRTVQHLVRIIR